MRYDDTHSLISLVYKKMNDSLTQKLSDAGLSNIVTSHGSIFNILFQEKELSMNEIAEKINKTPQTVTVLVKKLISMGYLDSRKSDKDGRSTIIFLTQQGMDLKPDFDLISKNMYDTRFKGIDEKEIEDFRKTLYKIINNLENK